MARLLVKVLRKTFIFMIILSVVVIIMLIVLLYCSNLLIMKAMNDIIEVIEAIVCTIKYLIIII